MNEPSERRKEPRKKVMTFIQVFDQAKDILLGHIRDLTLQGALVVGEEELDVNTQITLALELPGGLPVITTTSMMISASVARCVEDKDSHTYKIGFEFTDAILNKCG